MSTVGELIQTARKRRGLTIAELAAAVGRSPGHIDAIVGRHLHGMPRTLYLVAVHLGISEADMRVAYIQDAMSVAAMLWDQEVYAFRVTECQDKELV